MKLQEKIRLADYTTFRIGGPAKYFVEVETKEDLKNVANFAKEKELPIFVIGEGSDILVSDNSFDAVVVQLINKSTKIDGELVVSEAGVKWDDLVEFCVNHKLQGIECLSGIPGTVGAAPVQNIGAYGQELKDVLIKVEVFDIEKGQFIFLYNEDCNFRYRESVFKEKKGRYIIFEVMLKLKKNGSPIVIYESVQKFLKENKIKEATLIVVRNTVLAIRSEKLDDPRKFPNAGSFFKNPIVEVKQLENIQKKFPEIPSFINGEKSKLFAGWLIEKCGWKGKRIGEVGVSNQNALVLVNYGEGTAEEIKELSQKIIHDVASKFGIKLEREVQFVNF